MLEVHDLTNDISYDARLNGWKNAILGVKYSKFSGKKIREKLENICSIHICWYIGTKLCTVVVILG